MAAKDTKRAFLVSADELKYAITGLAIAKELALDGENDDLADRLGAATEMLKMVRDGYPLKMKK